MVGGTPAQMWNSWARCLPLTWAQRFSGKSGLARVPLGSVNPTSTLRCVADMLWKRVASSVTGGGLGFPGTLKSTTALHDAALISALISQAWSLPLGLMVMEVPETATLFLSPSCMSAKTVSRDMSHGSSDPRAPASWWPAPSSTQRFSGYPSGASVPPGSVNSSSVLSDVAESEYHSVASKLTGGGFGLPGTLKSMVALHNSVSTSDFTTHDWLLPKGLIVIEVPAMVTSFLSPSWMSANTPCSLVGQKATFAAACGRM
mmetsp:Transcript_66571/g.187496  ORF Transcript_66571/g.187496 Transcript_66571/m.187496 type:complete len:260 (-) Transcript_66571:377-1156(-)